ncbi:MAG: zinc-ribbon domain-containing protein [Arenibacterium sp.]
MRITCPNCGAQYEVPDQVIPDEGRDVQCSNCGNTWFQEHPDHTNSGDDDRELIAEPSNEPENEPDPQPEPDPRPEPEPEPEFDDEIDEEPAHAEEDTPEPLARELDPEVADILREEAELETRLRESEASVGIESQTELGLDSHGDDEATRRAREARDRMARMRGEEPDEEFEPTDDEAADLSPRPRSRLLPDVDDINTAIQDDDSTANVPADPETPMAEPVPQRRGGFGRGFGLILLLGVVLVLLYANADTVTEAVPAAAGPMDSYVAQVDKLRIWLDSQLSGFIPQ